MLVSPMLRDGTARSAKQQNAMVYMTSQSTLLCIYNLDVHLAVTSGSFLFCTLPLAVLGIRSMKCTPPVNHLCRAKRSLMKLKTSSSDRPRVLRTTNARGCSCPLLCHALANRYRIGGIKPTFWRQRQRHLVFLGASQAQAEALRVLPADL